MASALRKIVVFLLGAVASLADASEYEVTYSGGGPVQIVGPSGTSWSQPYASSASGRGGGSTSKNSPSGFSGKGSVACNGPITATLTWDGGPNNDPRPKSVVILKTASATWSGDSGGASNGLGDPCVPGEYAGSSQGTEYELVNNPPATITRTVTPSANATCAGMNPDAPITATANV